MDPIKVEFKELIELMGWSQTMAARRLHKTPSAINHLVNPDHPNKPSPTTMQLLKVIIAGERPDLINPQTFQAKEAPPGARLQAGRLGPRERKLIAELQKLPTAEQEKIYAIINVLLQTIGRKSGQAKK